MNRHPHKKQSSVAGILDQFKFVLLGIVAVVAVIIGAMTFVNHKRAANEDQAAYAFKDVKEVFDAKVDGMEPDADALAAMQNNDKGDSSKSFKSVDEKYERAIELLNAIVDKYPGTRTEKLSHFYLGTAYFFLKKSDEALKNFEDARGYFTKQPEFSSLINDAVAHVYEQKGDMDKAIESYNMIAEGKETFLKDYAYYNLGRCYEVKMDIQKAAEYYKRLKSEFPKSPMMTFADKRLSVIAAN